MTDHVQALHDALPDDPHSQYILDYVDLVPHEGNRQDYARWIHELYTTKSVKGGDRALTSVYRTLHGPQRFLESLEDTPLVDATNEDFLLLWLDDDARNSRTLKQCQRGPLTNTTINAYMVACYRMVRSIYGRKTADLICDHDKLSKGARDLIAELVPWNKVHQILDDLTGVNRVLFILATFTGLRIEEIRTLPVDAITYDFGETIVTVTRDNRTRHVPIYMFGGDVRNYQKKIRRNGSGQTLLFPSKKNINEPLGRQNIWVRFKKWGTRNGVPGLHAERLRKTYAAWLLSTGRANEHFIQYLQGQAKDESVQELEGKVAELLTARTPHNFGTPNLQASQFLPGYRPCVECGEQQNPIRPGASYCIQCGNELPTNPPSKATYLVSKLAGIAEEMRELMGKNREDRAQDALDLLDQLPEPDHLGEEE